MKKTFSTKEIQTLDDLAAHLGISVAELYRRAESKAPTRAAKFKRVRIDVIVRKDVRYLLQESSKATGLSQRQLAGNILRSALGLPPA